MNLNNFIYLLLYVSYKNLIKIMIQRWASLIWSWQFNKCTSYLPCPVLKWWFLIYFRLLFYSGILPGLLPLLDAVPLGSGWNKFRQNKIGLYLQRMTTLYTSRQSVTLLSGFETHSALFLCTQKYFSYSQKAPKWSKHSKHQALIYKMAKWWSIFHFTVQHISI